MKLDATELKSANRSSSLTGDQTFGQRMFFVCRIDFALSGSDLIEFDAPSVSGPCQKHQISCTVAVWSDLYERACAKKDNLSKFCRLLIIARLAFSV